MACDYLGEYIVREAQDLIPANYNESTAKYHSEVISPQLMFFQEVRKQEVRKRAMQETSAPNRGYHSSQVNRLRDAEWIAGGIKNDRLMDVVVGRKPVNCAAPDLFAEGLASLADATRITAYKVLVARNKGLDCTLPDLIPIGDGVEDVDQEVG